PFIGPFLRLMGALPVQRRQEAGNDPARNAALFAATTATLQAGGAILIFPEGRTQPEPVLMDLRTGAARMLLAAEGGGGAAPARIAEFRRRLESFDRELEAAGLTTAQSARAYTSGGVARFALREGFALLVGAPLAAAGIVIHAVPYLATAAIVRRLHRTDEEE